MLEVILGAKTDQCNIYSAKLKITTDTDLFSLKSGEHGLVQNNQFWNIHIETTF